MLRKRPRFVRVLWVCLFLTLASSCSFASARDRTIAQFAHTAWRTKDGAPSPVLALAQTTDGYLWVGAWDGLYRFDGVVFEHYEPQSGGPFPSEPVTALLALPNGDLWVGFMPGAISLLRSGNAVNYAPRDGLPSQWISSLAQDRQGVIWAATLGGLVRFEGGRWQEIGQDWNFPGKVARALFVDRQGTLWADAGSTLVSLANGASRFQPTGISVGQVPQIVQSPGGKLWMAETTRSVRPIPLSDKGQPSEKAEIQIGSQAVLFDDEGALWVTSLGNGLVRSQMPELLKGINGISSAAIDSFTARDGLSDDIVSSILEDREGNIWVGTNNGLDRFRKTNLVPVVLPFKTLNVVLAPAKDGDVMVANPGTMVRVHGAHAELIPSLAGEPLSVNRTPSGEVLWICKDAIYRYNSGRDTRVTLPWSSKLDSPRKVVATFDGSGTLWLSAESEGLFYRRTGIWNRLRTEPDVGKLSPRTAYTDWMGRAWFGFLGGSILLVNDEGIQRAFSERESPVGSVQMINGRGRHIWAAGQLGLAYFDGNRFRRIAPADAERFGPLQAVEESPNGDLWLAGNTQVIRIAATEIQQAIDDPSHRVKFRSCDAFDGLPGTLAGVQPLGIETHGTDGRLWFLTSNGIAWIDPASILTNPIPPPVSIRSITANGRVSDSFTNIVLPPRTTDLQIDYAALSLSVPEKIRFRYKLAGVNRDWQDAGNRREAFYNGLGPGTYHFQVVACNNDGVWNDVGSTLDFKIAPAWFQTIWFRGFSGCFFLFLLRLLYQVRVKQLQRQFEIGLEARVDERTRIARELHDTLLQDLHGVMFQFQAVHNLLDRRPEEAKQSLVEAIADTKKALAESRDAIQGLRSEQVAGGHLGALLTTASEELTHARDGERKPPTFVLIEEGERRSLSQAIRDEVSRVAVEVLRNAYQHAHADHIEAELRYGVEAFRIRIRDDGRGIAPDVLREGGRPGHWGLRGIRERAERIGGQLDFWSECGAGTEVQITVPGPIAYERAPNGVWSRWPWNARIRGRHRT